MTESCATILVTGAAGFIGSAVAARLADEGETVAGCDNFNSYCLPWLKQDRVDALLRPRGVVCEMVELADAKDVEHLFSRHRPALVVHLAAQAGVRHSLEHPDAYVQSNLVAFGHLLEACRRHAVRHLVYASSSSVYGICERKPFSEGEATDKPISLYAATKKANELMAYSYSHLHGLPATGLRFFTVYGPWGRPDMATFQFTQKILAGEKLPLFGNGELERDFTYIDDVVEGIVRVLRKPPAAAAGQPPHAVFNIGNSQPVRMRAFVQMLERLLGKPAAVDLLPMQPGDVAATCADTSRLQAWTGFAPSMPLEEGLGRFAAWYREWTAGSRTPA